MSQEGKVLLRIVETTVAVQNQNTCSDQCDYFIDKVFGTVARCTLFNKELKNRQGSRDKWSRTPACVSDEVRG
jgi:hypothetical protein